MNTFKKPYSVNFKVDEDGNKIRTNRVVQSFIDENGEPEVSLTQQHLMAETDIHNILRKYDKTGLVTHVNNAQAFYGDYTEINEYQENYNMVLRAQEMFMELPSAIRKRFGNDAGQYFEFVTNPDNYEDMVKLGLANARPETPPAAAPTEPTGE